MTEDRKQYLKDMRTVYANLTKDERTAIAKECTIVNLDGHILSPTNTIMVYLQAHACQQPVPTVVTGYQQWRKAGKQVIKGQHGYTIWFPVGPKTEEGDVVDAERFFTTTVFDISQVTAIEVKELVNA
jgi:hypothetical protein